MVAFPLTAHFSLRSLVMCMQMYLLRGLKVEDILCEKFFEFQNVYTTIQ